MDDFACSDEVPLIKSDFLAKVIPNDGVNFMLWADRAADRKGQIPVGDLDALAARLAEFCGRGCDVYHACASFADRSTRKAANASLVKSLYIDLDCGEEKAREGKGYATKTEAEAALHGFCDATGLPVPLLVDSGGGLHVYWPFKAGVSAAEWKTVAERFKALCAAIGLMADPQVTADAARVLRPIGSFNWKFDPPRRVALLKDSGPFCFEALRDKIDNACAKVGVSDCHERKRSQTAPLLPRSFGELRVPDRIKASPHYAEMMQQTVRIAGGLNASWDETPDNVAKVKAMLACIPPDVGRPTWRQLAWSIASLGWTSGEKIFTDWSKGCDKYWSAATDGGAEAQKQIGVLFSGYEANRGTSIGTLDFHARQHGFGRPTTQTVARTSYVELLQDRQHITSSNKGPLANMANIKAVLTESHEWCDRFAYNEMADEVTVLAPILGARTPHKTFKPHQLREVDILATMAWLQRNRFPSIAKETVANAITLAAHEQIISPVRYYLEDLEARIQWTPGTQPPKLQRFCADYLGAAEDAKTPGSEPDYLVSDISADGTF